MSSKEVKFLHCQRLPHHDGENRTSTTKAEYHTMADGNRVFKDLHVGHQGETQCIHGAVSLMAKVTSEIRDVVNLDCPKCKIQENSKRTNVRHEYSRKSRRM